MTVFSFLLGMVIGGSLLFYATIIYPARSLTEQALVKLIDFYQSELKRRRQGGER